MTEKNIKKLLTKLGVPAEKQTVIIEESAKDDEEWDETDVLEAAKAWAMPLVKDAIAKEARDGANAGSVLKALKAVWTAIKDDSTPDFEEWKKTIKGKDYADVISESIVAAKSKGLTEVEAVKALQKKLDETMLANKDFEKKLTDKDAEFAAKLSERDLRDLLKAQYNKYGKKPINEDVNDLYEMNVSKRGFEIKLHDGVPTLFKKGETTPLQNDKKTAIVTVETDYSSYAETNENFFVQSGGSGGGGEGDPDPLKKPAVKDLGNNIVQKAGHRGVPADLLS